MKLSLPKLKRTDKAPTKRPLGKGAPLSSFWLTAFIWFALVAAITLAGLAYLQQERVGQSARDRVDLQVEALGLRLSQTLGLYHRLLQGMGQDVTLGDLLASGNPQAVEERAEILTGLLPEVLRVRLLPLGSNRTDRDSTPPFSYASLELVRAAEEAAETPPLEVHQAKGAAAHVAGAVLLRGTDGSPRGVLFAAFDPKPVRAWLAGLGAVPGRVEIQQRVDGRDTALYISAQAVQVGQAAPNGIRPVAGSLLRIVHWYGPQGLFQGDFLFSALTALGVLLILCGLIFSIQYRRLRKQLDADQASLVHMVEDSLAGKTPRTLDFRIRDFAYVRELLAQRLKALNEQGGGIAEGAGAELSAIDGAVPSGGSEGKATRPPVVAGGMQSIPEEIFRAYDIRGVVGASLTPGVVREIGRAIGSQAYEQGQQTVIVARDGGDSGAELADALMAGLTATGRDVIDMGVVPVPLLYFATHFLGSNTGVMVTASHNDPEYNGLMVVMGGETLDGPQLLELRERVLVGDLLEGEGTSQPQDLVPDYIERIADDVSIARPLKVVVDCGSGSGALVAPGLFRALGCDVVELYCQVDNTYPGHYPDPSRPENLTELQQSVLAEGADLGLAMDADGDRIGVVDSSGRVIWPDRLMMLLSADVLSRHPGGDIIFDVKSSRSLASQILQNGGRPVMWKSGHTLLKAKLRETGALMAGEWSGHVMFRERWYGFDDAMYTGARLLEILAVDPRSTAEVFADYPEFVTTPELYLEVNEGQQFALMDQAQQRSELLAGAKLTTIDGLRAELEDGWGLMRASNTEPAIGFRFEADSKQALARIQDLYRGLMAEVAPGVSLPF